MPCEVTESDNQAAKDFNRAFEIHKDADTQLHSRISAFTIAQSFLVTGFVNLFRVNPDFSFTVISLIIPIVAIIFCGIYFFYCRRLTKGIFFLKEEYLEKNDTIYCKYIKAARGNKKRPYAMATLLISAMTIFWFCAVSLVIGKYYSPAIESHKISDISYIGPG